MDTTTQDLDNQISEVTETVERRSERGASLVEYALLVALIAVVCLGAVTFFGEATSSSVDASGQSIFSPG